MSDLLGVFYTDGGCRPSNGYGGWGFHGYAYSYEVGKQGTGLKDWLITPIGYVKKNAFTDIDLIHIWDHITRDVEHDNTLVESLRTRNVKVDKYLDGFGSLGDNSTNNQAEVCGLINAMKEVEKHSFKKVMFYIDSRYVLDGVTEWHENWVKNGWVKSDGKMVSNHEQWKELLEIKESLINSGVEIIFDWVKGHVGNLGNEKADNNATKGVIVSKKGLEYRSVKEHPAGGYWNPSVDNNRMISHKAWYFNTGTDVSPKTPCGKTIYHIGKHGKDSDFLGKPMSDAAFSVIFAEHEEPGLEVVRKVQNSLDDSGLTSIVIGKLDNINKPAYSHEIIAEEGLTLQQKGFKFDLYTPDDNQITEELRPPRLAFNVVEIMNTLESILLDFMGGKTREDLVFSEITDIIYERINKGSKVKSKLLPNIDSLTKSISVKVPYNLLSSQGESNIKLTLGMDIPDRNTLSALAGKDPQVWVVTWRESKQAFRYASIVKAGNDYGIWVGFYSNIHLLTS
ncbi:MAG: hypothetical protein IBX57_01020 [Gammaproteobacteria bacterium]|nr:hypothetical protein [Gammaproteobacteria bacterium]